MDDNSIGIFDSGLGGLTVVKKVREILPNENILYLGDTARVPYGNRSSKIINKFANECLKYLILKNVKCIIVACNTVSSYALGSLKEKTNIVIFDVIAPGVSESLKHTKNNRIGVIGTYATIKSNSYIKSLRTLSKDILVKQNPCPLLVPMIEEGVNDKKIIDLVLKKYLYPIKQSKCDVLILGCTHYPILKTEIQKIMGDKVFLVDPALELSRQVESYLASNNLLRTKTKCKLEVNLTDFNQNFKLVASNFLSEKNISYHLVNILNE